MTSETHHLTKEEWERAKLEDIDPLIHAGEGHFALDEYTLPSDIENPYTRGALMREGDYYAPADEPRNQIERFLMMGGKAPKRK